MTQKEFDKLIEETYPEHGLGTRWVFGIVIAALMIAGVVVGFRL